MKCYKTGTRERSQGKVGWEEEAGCLLGPTLPGSFRSRDLPAWHRVLLLCCGSLPGWSQATLASVETTPITGSMGRQPVPSATASASGITPSSVAAMAGSSSSTVSIFCAHCCWRHGNPWAGDYACSPALPSVYFLIHLPIPIRHLLQARHWPDPAIQCWTLSPCPLEGGYSFNK